MNIRLAQLEDLPRIDRIYNQAITEGQKTADLTPWSETQRLQWFQEHDSEKYPLFVADISGEVVGYATVSPYRKGREALRFTVELSLYIAAEHRLMGVGHALMTSMLNFCETVGIKSVFGIIMDTNIGSIALMKKFGFVQWAHMPNIADFDGVEVGHVYYGKRLGLANQYLDLHALRSN